MTAVIEARQLGRWYGQVMGLGELDVSIAPGVTGLVGPNGAGKSTFLKLAVGELKPSRGDVAVLDERPFANRRLYARLGFCPQQDALYDHLTGLQHLTLLLRLSGFPRTEARQRAVRALERVHLEPAMERRTGGYSKGMRQRVKLAQAIAHGPEFVIADEPLAGLDPVARAQTTALFRELASQGTSLLVSSHVLHEVEGLTDSIVLLHRGRLLAQGSVPAIRRLLSRHPRKVDLVARDVRRLAGLLVELDDVRSIQIDSDEQLAVETADLDAFLAGLTRIAAVERAGLRSVESRDASLEAVFDYLVG